MNAYDPVPDAIAALQTKTASQRQAIARLLGPDGPSLEVLGWVVTQPDCDVATAAMIFWRLLTLPIVNPSHNAQDRVPILERIVNGLRDNEYGPAANAWDGKEAWDRTPLIGGMPLPGLNGIQIPHGLSGPFVGHPPEPASYAFFEIPYAKGEDDIFDSLWRVTPANAAAADWLIGKSADVWMAAPLELAGRHPTELYLWMLRQPECPTPVAGQVFWLCDPIEYSRRMLDPSSQKFGGLFSFDLLSPILDRWRTNGFAPSDLDFSRFARPAEYRALLNEFSGKPDPLQIPADLLDPVPGKPPAVLRLTDDFDFWCITHSGGHVRRPRSAAVQEWQRRLTPNVPEPPRGWKWRDLFRRQK